MGEAVACLGAGHHEAADDSADGDVNLMMDKEYPMQVVRHELDSQNAYVACDRRSCLHALSFSCLALKSGDVVPKPQYLNAKRSGFN